jgi:hypothetical protein
MKSKLTIEESVIKALVIAFKISDDKITQSDPILSITLEQIKQIIIEHKLFKGKITNRDIGGVMYNLGFSDTGKDRIIMRSYLDIVIEESNPKL